MLKKTTNVTEQEIVIRIAGEEDMLSLSKLLIETQLKPTITIGVKTIYLFASLNGVTIAMIGAELGSYAALIRSAAVLPAYRERGIAKLLITSLGRELIRKDVTDLYLFSKSTGFFWKKLGFAICPVENVISAIPDSPQVIAYINDDSIWTDTAWFRVLNAETPL